MKSRQLICEIRMQLACEGFGVFNQVVISVDSFLVILYYLCVYNICCCDNSSLLYTMFVDNS